jgi:hypothetical protein
LLEPKEKDQEDVDYVERAKKKIPRVLIALMVLLVFTNVIGKLSNQNLNFESTQLLMSSEDENENEHER